MQPVPILIVDDDVELCTALGRLLAMEGFSVTAVHDAPTGAREALNDSYSLVVLDIMLPGGDGREVLRKIRRSSTVPVIMLTARGDERDRVLGLESGADDYLSKPFSPRELIARIRAVLRRREPTIPNEPVAVGDLEVHIRSRTVLRAGEEVSLTGAEFDILLVLLRSAGKVLSRDELALAALGRPTTPLDRSIDNHISNLRKKLGHYTGNERIKSVRGAGYVYTGEDR